MCAHASAEIKLADLFGYGSSFSFKSIIVSRSLGVMSFLSPTLDGKFFDIQLACMYSLRTSSHLSWVAQSLGT